VETADVHISTIEVGDLVDLDGEWRSVTNVERDGDQFVLTYAQGKKNVTVAVPTDHSVRTVDDHDEAAHAQTMVEKAEALVERTAEQLRHEDQLVEEIELIAEARRREGALEGDLQREFGARLSIPTRTAQMTRDRLEMQRRDLAYLNQRLAEARKQQKK
jgi:hypothetical protein